MASNNLSPQEPKPKGDPKATIKQILKIVDQLHTKLLPSPSRSSDAGLKSQKRSFGSVSSALAVSFGQDDSENVIPKLQSNLYLLREGLSKVQNLREDVGNDVSKHIHLLNSLLERVEYSKTQLTIGMKKDLEDINKKIFNLMFQVPLLPNSRIKHGSDFEDRDGENDGRGIVCSPGIHTNDGDLKTRAVFRYVQDEFKNFTTESQICLLSFAVFPENQEVNRTMLMYWWIGEGILPVTGAGDAVKEIIKEFTDKLLIEAVENKRKVEPNSYKMNPFVHSSVVLISKEIGLFDMYPKGYKPSMGHSKLHKVCLVEEPSKAIRMRQVDRIETVFNVSERFPDFTFKWFHEKHPSRKKMLGRRAKTTYENLMVFQRR